MNDNLPKNTLSINSVNEIVKNFVDFINSSDINKNKEILKIPSMTLLTDIEYLIKNNPDLVNGTTEECTETKDLKNYLNSLKKNTQMR